MNAVGRLGVLVCTLVAVAGATAQFPAPTQTLKLPEPRAKVSSAQPVPGKEVGEKKEAWKAWQPTGSTLTLGECLAIGQEKQPAIVAATASLAAAERGYLALLGLRPAAELFSPDLPVRRQQSKRGLAAPCAEVVKVRQENTYDVCRLYFTYVYATQQEQTASDIVTQLEGFYELLLELLKLPPDPKIKVNEFTLGSFDAVIAEVKDLREKASTGRKKALEALKEAMGVPDLAFVPADKELPLMGGTVDQATVVSLALSRRSELVQSAVLVDVTRLEVTAQGKLAHERRAGTFAGGSDLHARPLPLPIRNGEYRPGAIPPEMPTEIVGKVDERVGRMCEHVRHSEAVYEKSVNLVRLEAINAFLNWEQAVKKVADARDRHKRQQDLVEKARAAATTKMDPELLIQQESLASKAQARYVDAVYEQILALIALEKVTGGGVVPAFPQR